MELYAYSDETTFERITPGVKDTVGSGVLLTDYPIDSNVIDEALLKLKNDPDSYKKDLKTLKNNHFHASEDSPNAHSHFCNAVNKYIRGHFNCSYFNIHDPNLSRTEETFMRLTMGLSSLNMFSYRSHKVNLFIEKRNGFTEKSAEIWLDNWLKEVDKHAYQHTSFVTYYPKVEITLSGKDNPGIQVADFMLWAFNRYHSIPSEGTWLNRITSNYVASHSEDNNPNTGGGLQIKNGIDSPNTLLNYPIAPVNLIWPDDFFNAYLFIGKTIHNLLNSGLPLEMHYFIETLSLVKSDLETKNNSVESIRRLGSLFIRLFDTLPIYRSVSDNNVMDWTTLLKAKKMAGLLVRNDLSESIRVINEVQRWKNS